MTKHLQLHIIELTRHKVLEIGEFSVREAARSLNYSNVSLPQQKKLAKLIVKSYPFVTQIKNGEVIVSNNKHYEGDRGNTEERYHILEYIVTFIVTGLLGYLLFNIFLPSL